MNEHLAMLTVFAPAIVMVVGCMIEASRERLHREPIEPPRRFAADGDAAAGVAVNAPAAVRHPLARGQSHH